MHATSPAGQTQAPETHVEPIGQSLPHWPQLLGSEERSTQPRFPPQFTWPTGHTQTPETHVEFGPQLLPH